jgi:sterol desaturase/sphingolipid hydroxylase (fatty acid hydroxylase superfamily)
MSEKQKKKAHISLETTAEPEAIDKNFSVHTPIWDRIFGTYYMPDRWPKAYGLVGDHKLPSNWLTQLIYPFMKK